MKSINKQEILLDKLNEPTEDMIKFCIGNKAHDLMIQLEKKLNEVYDLNHNLRFWDNWQRGYWHKKVWLLDLIFREDSLFLTMTITDKKVNKMEEIQHKLQPKLQEIWKNRKKYGPSSWPIEFEVVTERDIEDLILILGVKQPMKKINNEH